MPQLVANATAAWFQAEPAALATAGAALLGCLDDLDALLSSCNGWLLGARRGLYCRFTLSFAVPTGVLHVNEIGVRHNGSTAPL
jgi:hypothetical protein